MKRLFLSILIASIALVATAQDSEPRGGRIEALKIAYLTKRLDLSPAEAQKFWPIYNSYAAEIRAARAEQRQNGTQELDTEDRILAIRKKYSSEFSRAISAEKINTFFRSEKEFGNYVQQELQERRQLRQQRNQ